MGPGARGFLPVLRGRAVTNDDGRPTGLYIARFRNLSDKDSRFLAWRASDYIVEERRKGNL